MTVGLWLLTFIFVEQGVAAGPLGSDFFIFGAGGFLILGAGDYFIFERCWVTRPIGAGDYLIIFAVRCSATRPIGAGDYFITFAVRCSAIWPLGVGDINNYGTLGH